MRDWTQDGVLGQICALWSPAVGVRPHSPLPAPMPRVGTRGRSRRPDAGSVTPQVRRAGEWGSEMQADEPEVTWGQTLADLPGLDVFGPAFMARYGDRRWDPTEADRTAAHVLRVELLSRISTQRLGYGQGVERAALKSVRALFERARQVTAANPGSSTFEVLVWHVMNAQARPFAAKWHPRSEAGLLDALDSSDEFREDLERLRQAFRALDGALRLLLGLPGYELADEDGPAAIAVRQELSRSVAWRPGGIAPGAPDPNSIHAEEAKAVRARRARYGIPDGSWATGIALSGGGIRSATFSIGVLSVLARRDLLPQFDYLSTVSGGGYAGAFLTQLLGAGPPEGIGLRRDQLPFRRLEGESALLRALRQRARYLSGTFWERVFVAMRQAYGLFVNLTLLLVAVAVLAYLDASLRRTLPDHLTAWLAVAAPTAAILAFALFARRLDATGTNPGWKHVLLGSLFVVPPLWYLLGMTHSGLDAVLAAVPVEGGATPGPLVTAWTAAGSALVVTTALAVTFTRVRPAVVATLTGLVALVAETSLHRAFASLDPGAGALALLVLVAAATVLLGFLDVNLTSLHGYYRAKLSAAFLLTPDGRSADPVKLSAVDTSRSPLPIINCALNVPGSDHPAMRGRLSDVFSLTPVSTGCALLGHLPTRDWEASNPRLDLATAMAVSGAAASPQMGLRTTRLGSFWLTLLNVRLGIWLHRPRPSANGRPAATGTGSPRLPYLLHELAATADETLDFLHISDGGHIENLGVYELLRRRCRFILAVDGESDPAMTFHALTNLQRLAYIDFGIRIEADLDDLRLGDSGLSRSHFRFCRILYPSQERPGECDVGYLVYVKLSLTGNEGEFIRRYRLDEPAFPHHPTVDQFFSEAQFEAYRSLGEHVGDKLFLSAIVGDIGKADRIDLELWIKALGRSFL